jgi:histidine kinase 2/3/4 (cytokinin receptor)
MACWVFSLILQHIQFNVMQLISFEKMESSLCFFSLGMLDMLLDTELKSTQRDYAQTAQVCGKALISLINEVLDRAKIEAGKIDLESVPFDLRSILDDVISLFSSKSREKGIELAVYVSERVPEILLGDPGRFRQIITNLVGNSIKVNAHNLCIHS